MKVTEMQKSSVSLFFIVHLRKLTLGLAVALEVSLSASLRLTAMSSCQGPFMAAASNMSLMFQSLIMLSCPTVASRCRPGS